jgi:DNA repair exonuclease SbcCD ATPase subunit
MNESQLLTLFAVGAGALWAVVWYLIRRGDQRLESETKERVRVLERERESRESAAAKDRALFMEAHERTSATFLAVLEKEREQAKADRHEFRDELSKWANLFQTYKLDATEKFVNRANLIDAMSPMRETMEGFRTDVRDLYEKIDQMSQRLNRGG